MISTPGLYYKTISVSAWRKDRAMKMRIPAARDIATVAVSLSVLGCFQFGDKDSKEAEPDAGPALGSFCQLVTQGSENATVTLRLENGSRQVDLTTETGTCNTGLDEACNSLPIGDNVRLKVIMNKKAVLSDSVEIESGKQYGFYLEADDETLPVLYRVDLSDDSDESSVCANNECTFGLYSPATCAPDDPCGWSNDGECDDACLNQSQIMFDDSADCTKTVEEQ